MCCLNRYIGNVICKNEFDFIVKIKINNGNLEDNYYTT